MTIEYLEEGQDSEDTLSNGVFKCLSEHRIWSETDNIQINSGGLYCTRIQKDKLVLYATKGHILVIFLMHINGELVIWKFISLSELMITGRSSNFRCIVLII